MSRHSDLKKMLRLSTLTALLISGVAAAQSNAARSVELPLDDFLKKASKSSFQIQIDRFDVGSASASYHELRDSFSPMLSASFNNTFPGTTNLGGVVSTNYVGISPVANYQVISTNAYPVATNRDFTITASKTFIETGSTIGLSMGGKYNDRNFLSGLSALSASSLHSWDGFLSASLTQSLLRGGPLGFMGIDTLRIAREQARLQKSVFNSKLGGNILAALQTYWTYELNQKLVKLQQESINDARDLLEKNRRRVAVGTVDISDVYSAEVTLADSENAKDLLERDIQNNKAQLLFLMGYTNIQPETIDLKLKDRLVFSDVELNEEKLLEVAKQNRKEFEQARISKDIAQSAYRQAKWALMPKLDLTLSASVYGFDTNNENWPDAIGNAFGRLSKPLYETNAVNFFVGLKFETPLDFGAYKTVVEKRGFEYQKAVKNEEMIHEQLALKIREHIRNLTYLKSVLERTKDALGVSEQKVAELRRQFNNGKIDSTKFNIGYDGLRGIQKLYYSTLVQYEVEKCSLELTQGIFLKNRGIAEENVKAFMW